MISFIHGWGFDKNFWGEVAAPFAADCHDLGFFAANHRDPKPYRPPKRIVCHSYGLIWLLRRHPQPNARVVAFNAVPNFAKLIAPRVLALMVNRWRSDPQAVLAEFLTKVGAPPARLPAAKLPAANRRLNHRLNRRLNRRLTEALVELATADVTAAADALGPRLLLVGSEDDQLLPPTKQRRLGVRLLKSGGHLLPKTEPSQCIQLIKGHFSPHR